MGTHWTDIKATGLGYMNSFWTGSGSGPVVHISFASKALFVTSYNSDHTNLQRQTNRNFLF